MISRSLRAFRFRSLHRLGNKPRHSSTLAIDDYVANSHVLHRALNHRPVEIVSGSGISFTLSDGRTMIDASSGPAVSCLGHHRPEVAQAVANQINSIGYVYSVGYTSKPAEELADMLLRDRPGGLSKAMFFGSGSEATDGAVKLVTQYWKEKGQPQRKNVIGRMQSYHGNTIGALCVSGHQSRREMYSDWMSANVSFVDPCYSYRARPEGWTDEEYLNHLVAQLDAEFQRLGPDTVSAFVAETIPGTTLGCVPALPGYFKAVRELCDKYGALLMLDEIICGMGKTGTMHAWEQEEGFRGPDLQTIGKTLGGGFVPLSAVLVHEKIFDALARGSKSLLHGHTFQAHPTACAAAIEVQNIIKRENLVENCRRMGAVLGKLMQTEILPLPLVGDVRGRGLYWAAEFILEKKTKKPFPIKDNFTGKVLSASLDRGLNLLGNLGKCGPIDVEHVMIAPPYIVTEEELVKLVQLLKEAIMKASEPYLDAEVEERGIINRGTSVVARRCGGVAAWLGRQFFAVAAVVPHRKPTHVPITNRQFIPRRNETSQDMILRPPLLRAPPLQDTGSVCLRCLRKISRSGPPPGRRLLSTTTPAKDAAVSSQSTRAAFKKEYFWANGILEEAISGARRGVWSHAVAAQARGNQGPAPSTLHQQPKIAQALESTATAGNEIANELPHRRRQRLREEAKKQAASETDIRPDASARLSNTAQALPIESLRRRFFTYLALSKPQLSFLIVLTTAATYAIYPVPTLLAPSVTDTPSLSTLTLLFLSTGTALASASANAFNMLFEPAHDAKMSRTRNRPIVRGLINKRGALLFAVATGCTGVVALYYGVNPTTAFLGALNIFIYAGCYTPMKRVSVINTWVGAIVGGIPPLMGWTAAAGQCATGGGTWQDLLFGSNSVGGWLMGALLFAWQFPHFNALSWTIREEYKNAGYRMLAWTNPRMNGRVALRYSFLMFPICFGLAYTGVTDWGFAVTSSFINGWMTYQATRFWWYEGQKGTARGLFWASVWHLPIVLVLAMAHKKGLWERVWRSVTGRSASEEDEEAYWEDEEVEEGPSKSLHKPIGQGTMSAGSK